MSTNRDYLEYMVKATGLSLSSPSEHKHILICAFLPLSCVIVVLSVINFRKDTDVLHMTAIFESCSTCGQPILRLLLMIFYSQVIQDVLKDRRKLWHWDACGEDFGNKAKRELDILWLVLRFFWSFSLATIAVFIATSLMSEGRHFPIECWAPENNALSIIVFITTVLVLLIALYMVGTVDGFFVFICTEIKLQFRLMSEAIRQIKHEGEVDLHREKVMLSKIKNCVELHTLLLGMFKKLNTALNEFFAAQYLVSLAAMCINMFIMSDRNVDFEQNVRGLMYSTALLLQLTLIFIPAEKLSYELYDVNWYNSKSLKFRKDVMLVLMKCQQPMYMRGGGMFYINRAVFLQIFRLSYTVAAILRRLRDQ